MARAAKTIAHDVEAEEGEAIIVVDAGDGRDRLAVDLADEETLRVGNREAGGIAVARIPALGRGAQSMAREISSGRRLRISKSLISGCS
ncbi:hypothetical protein ABH987_004703 [Bradyrhizobium ottawaense]